MVTALFLLSGRNPLQSRELLLAELFAEVSSVRAIPTLPSVLERFPTKDGGGVLGAWSTVWKPCRTTTARRSAPQMRVRRLFYRA